LVVNMVECRYRWCMSRGGADLALLLLGGFRFMAEEAKDRLAARGYPGVRPAHDFWKRADMFSAAPILAMLEEPAWR